MIAAIMGSARRRGKGRARDRRSIAGRLPAGCQPIAGLA
jgi:hypothetical protein